MCFRTNTEWYIYHLVARDMSTAKVCKTLNGFQTFVDCKLAYIVILILICIIQLLTLEALNMMWYPPENINIERGDVLLNTNCQLQSKTLSLRLIDQRSSTITSVFNCRLSSRKLPWQITYAYQKSLETAFSIATGKRKTPFFRLIDPRSSTVMSVFDCWLSG